MNVGNYSLNELALFNFIEKHNYYLHKMIYRRDYDMINQLLNSKISNKSEILEEKDHRGNTPLMLAVKLIHLSKDYGKIARLLLRHGSFPKVRDRNGWSVLDEAVEKGDKYLISEIFDSLVAYKQEKWNESKKLSLNALERLPDFYLEMKWKFDSSVIPLLSRIAPRDTIKIWKVGRQIRFDMTLVGYKNLRTKRRNISIIFRDTSRPDWFVDGHRDKDIILINHSKQLLVNPVELPDAEEKLAILNDITRVDPV